MSSSYRAHKSEIPLQELSKTGIKQNPNLTTRRIKISQKIIKIIDCTQYRQEKISRIINQTQIISS